MRSRARGGAPRGTPASRDRGTTTGVTAWPVSSRAEAMLRTGRSAPSTSRNRLPLDFSIIRAPGLRQAVDPRAEISAQIATTASSRIAATPPVTSPRRSRRVGDSRMSGSARTSAPVNRNTM
nr:hypothetical protein [Frankia sp. ArI3]